MRALLLRKGKGGEGGERRERQGKRCAGQNVSYVLDSGFRTNAFDLLGRGDIGE